jgi:hypothetical protein
MVLFGGALGTAVACGGSSVGDEGVPIEEVPQMYADTLCQVFERCYEGLLSVYLPGEDFCAGVEQSVQDVFPRIVTAVENGRIRYNGNLIEDCLQETTSRSCEALNERSSDTCDAALDGTVAIGDDCYMDEECEGAAFCEFSSACPGTCTALKGAGATCDRNDQCSSGLECSDATGLCVTPAGAGDRCEGGTEPPCSAGLMCLGNDDAAGQPGNCRTISEVFNAQMGETCNPETGPLCASGLACVVEGIDTTSGQPIWNCSSPVASGTVCQPGAPDPCPTDEFCSFAAMTLEGICRPKPVEGEACAMGLGGAATLCAPNLRCDGGTCRERRSLGEPCTEDAVCYSESCVGGGCRDTGGCE